MLYYNITVVRNSPMVSWKLLAKGYEVEVTFEDVEDETVWQELKTKGYGVAALAKLPWRLETSGNVSSSEMDTIEIAAKRRYLSLPEIYYAVAIDGLLPLEESLQEVWKKLESSSGTFARDFVIYQHFHRRGWIPRSGLNYGAHYVLYRGSAAEFHSEYVVYVQDDGVAASWNQIQSLTRIAADVKKTVLLCSVTMEQASGDVSRENAVSCTVNSPDSDFTFGNYSFHGIQYTVEAIAIRFWDASIANEPKSYAFLPQPVLPKKMKSVKKKRIKQSKHRFEDRVRTGLENSSS